MSRRNIKNRICNFIKWVVWDFSCLRFIWSKILPPTGEPEGGRRPSTFLFWVFGIYIACFGIASQRYENRLDVIENRANTIFTQLASPAFKSALSRISIVQQMSCPQTPKLLNPLSVFHSLFGSGKEYSEIVFLLKQTVENWKESLEAVDLSYANLEEAQLRHANLRKTTLIGANLRNVNLMDADLKNANLGNADLQNADLTNADLQNADLTNADLRYSIIIGAKFEGAYLTNANLININAPPPPVREKHELDRRMVNKKTYGKYLPPEDYLPGDLVDQLSRAENLYNAKLDPKIKDQLIKLNQNLFRNPIPYAVGDLHITTQ